jgi:hypothetical protein
MGTNILNILMNVTVVMLLCSTLKVEAAGVSISMVPFHQTTWHHIQEEHTLIMKLYFISKNFKLKISDGYRLLCTDTILNEKLDIMFGFPKFTFFQLEL